MVIWLIIFFFYWKDLFTVKILYSCKCFLFYFKLSIVKYLRITFSMLIPVCWKLKHWTGHLKVQDNCLEDSAVYNFFWLLAWWCTVLVHVYKSLNVASSIKNIFIMDKGVRMEESTISHAWNLEPESGRLHSFAIQILQIERWVTVSFSFIQYGYLFFSWSSQILCMLCFQKMIKSLIFLRF